MNWSDLPNYDNLRNMATSLWQHLAAHLVKQWRRQKSHNTDSYLNGRYGWIEACSPKWPNVERVCWNTSLVTDNKISMAFSDKDSNRESSMIEITSQFESLKRVWAHENFSKGLDCTKICTKSRIVHSNSDNRKQRYHTHWFNDSICHWMANSSNNIRDKTSIKLFDSQTKNISDINSIYRIPKNRLDNIYKLLSNATPNIWVINPMHHLNQSNQFKVSKVWTLN